MGGDSLQKMALHEPTREEGGSSSHEPAPPGDKSRPMVSFLELFQYASKWDAFLLWIGGIYRWCLNASVCRDMERMANDSSDSSADVEEKVVDAALLMLLSGIGSTVLNITGRMLDGSSLASDGADSEHALSCFDEARDVVAGEPARGTVGATIWSERFGWKRQRWAHQYMQKQKLKLAGESKGGEDVGAASLYGGLIVIDGGVFIHSVSTHLGKGVAEAFALMAEDGLRQGWAVPCTSARSLSLRCCRKLLGAVAFCHILVCWGLMFCVCV